jgi:hypothetical protein
VLILRQRTSPHSNPVAWAVLKRFASEKNRPFKDVTARLERILGHQYRYEDWDDPINAIIEAGDDVQQALKNLKDFSSKYHHDLQRENGDDEEARENQNDSGESDTAGEDNIDGSDDEREVPDFADNPIRMGNRKRKGSRKDHKLGKKQKLRPSVVQTQPDDLISLIPQSTNLLNQFPIFIDLDGEVSAKTLSSEYIADYIINRVKRPQF